MSNKAQCPYCGHEMYVELCDGFDDDRHLIECTNPSCNKVFSILIEFDPIFNEMTEEEHDEYYASQIDDTVVQTAAERAAESELHNEREFERLIEYLTKMTGKAP